MSNTDVPQICHLLAVLLGKNTTQEDQHTAPCPSETKGVSKQPHIPLSLGFVRQSLYQSKFRTDKKQAMKNLTKGICCTQRVILIETKVSCEAYMKSNDKEFLPSPAGGL